MGGPMCRNLVGRAGLPAIVHDVEPGARAACALQGCVATAEPGRVARACDAIFLSLPGAAEVRRVCLGEDGLLEHARAGDIIVDCSTVPLDLTRELAAVFAERRAAYVDAPVAGTVQSVADRKIAIMAGTDRETFARLAPLLACMASPSPPSPRPCCSAAGPAWTARGSSRRFATDATASRCASTA